MNKIERVTNAFEDCEMRAMSVSDNIIECEINTEYAEITGFVFDRGEIRNVEVDSQSITTGEFYFDGNDASDYVIVDKGDYADLRAAISELKAEDTEPAESVDMSDYVSVSALESVLRDLLMIKPADASEATSIATFTSVYDVITLAREAEAIEQIAEQLESGPVENVQISAE